MLITSITYMGDIQ